MNYLIPFTLSTASRRNIIAELNTLEDIEAAKRNMITHLQVNLSSELLVQLFYAYSRSVRNARSQITGDGDVMSTAIEVILKTFEHNGENGPQVIIEPTHRRLSRSHEPGEYLIFFLERPDDYVYRPFRTRDNMRRETRYGKRVPHISSPSRSSCCLKSIMQI